jgi:hypothetical protein
VYQAVGVLVDQEHRQGAFNVQLNLNMALPASDPPHDVVILLADLSRSGVRVQEPWEHDPDFTTWWSADELEPAWRAFEEFGMPWLDHHRQPVHLISYFEDEYRRLEAAHPKSTAGSPLRRVMKRTGLSKRSVVPGYPQYLLWLSMLHQSQGNREKALDLLDSYREWAETRGLRREMERLVRHRALLER